MESTVFAVLQSFTIARAEPDREWTRVLALFYFLVHPCALLSFIHFVIRSKIPNVKGVFDFLNLLLANAENFTTYILSIMHKDQVQYFILKVRSIF